MKYLLNCRSFIFLMVLFSFFDNFGMKKENYTFKVVFVGDAAVGKTQIINKFVNDKFDASYKLTVGVEFAPKVVDFENKKIKLQLWDTAGQESYKSIIKNYYKDSHLIAFVYDINTRDSFNSILKYWVEDVKKQNKDAKFLLVGNKCDLKEDKRQVTKEEAKKYAEDNNMKFIEVSAKTGEGINDMFNYIISELLKDMEKEKKEKIQVKNPNKDVELNHNNNDLSCWNKYCSCCPCL